MLNNDSLLSWCVGAVLGWTLFGALVSIPVHNGFGVSFSSVVVFVAIQCALQVVASPWMFAARATAANPGGKPGLRAVVVIVWFMLAGVAACLQLFSGGFTNKGTFVVFLGTPLLLGSLFLFALYWFTSRKKALDDKSFR